MKTITRKLVIDVKGTLAPFKFIEFTIGDRSVFVKEELLVNGKIPEEEGKALTEFLCTEEVQEDLMDFSVSTVLVRSLYTDPKAYSCSRPTKDMWIK